MNGRTYVLIFFFWAVLTILTPTLIRLSESSKPDMNFNDAVEKSAEVKVRRMMGYIEKQPRAEIAAVPAEAPAPSPEPTPQSGVSGSRESAAVLRRFLKKR